MRILYLSLGFSLALPLLAIEAYQARAWRALTLRSVTTNKQYARITKDYEQTVIMYSETLDSCLKSLRKKDGKK